MLSETVRFQLDTEEGMAEFAHLLPSGGHLVYIHSSTNTTVDPEPYTVTLFHQLRCLDVLRQGYTGLPEKLSSSGLLHHCMNYLRQTILCRPRLLLVKQAVLPRRRVSNMGFESTCANWEAVYEEAERNYGAYQDWLSSL